MAMNAFPISNSAFSASNAPTASVGSFNKMAPKQVPSRVESIIMTADKSKPAPQVPISKAHYGPSALHGAMNMAKNQRRTASIKMFAGQGAPHVQKK